MEIREGGEKLEGKEQVAVEVPPNGKVFYSSLSTFEQGTDEEFIDSNGKRLDFHGDERTPGIVRVFDLGQLQNGKRGFGYFVGTPGDFAKFDRQRVGF